jgi:hypothetical protein
MLGKLCRKALESARMQESLRGKASNRFVRALFTLSSLMSEERTQF